MKKLISLLMIATLFISCSDDDDRATLQTPVSQLPPPTQTGANTFGCLLDGEVFKPGFYNNSYQCFYQLVDGEYYFSVSADKRVNNILTGLTIGTKKLQVSQGQTLALTENEFGNALGLYYTGNSNTGTEELYYTSVENTGELKITKLDFTNNIVSGTFWFDIKDNQGIIHQIREGRFDMQFTQ